jgi:hypothetical protein
MAKVTIVMEDSEVDGKPSMEISGDFDQPGKSYDEMVADPTRAVASGLMLMSILCEQAASFKGYMRDEFGNQKVYDSTDSV